MQISIPFVPEAVWFIPTWWGAAMDIGVLEYEENGSLACAVVFQECMEAEVLTYKSTEVLFGSQMVS